MRLQRMLGHLTTLVPEKPETVLVIGCGAGVTAGAVSHRSARRARDDRRDRAARAAVVSTYFAEHNFDVVAQSEGRRPHRRCAALPADDEREVRRDHVGPARSVGKGAAMLYTREFFELAKEHLNPGGVVTLFVQLYESNTEAVKSEIATFFEVFPNGMVFGNTLQRRRLRPRAARPGRADADRPRRDGGAAAAARSTRRREVAARDRHVTPPIDLFATYAGLRDGLAADGSRTRRSTATATCGCSIWPDSG